MIFYIHHFSLIIFNHSVWLGFELFGLRVQVHSQLVQLRSRSKDMTITICHNKPPTGNGAGVLMTSCTEEMVLRIWGFEKDGAGFWPLKDVVGFFGSLPTEILDRTRCAARWGVVSIIWLAKTFKNCVSLIVSPWTQTRS